MGQINVNPIWREVWKLLCLAKVKIFTWRTLHGTLLRHVMLANRHMKVSPPCPSCFYGAECTKHLMFLCDKVRWFGEGWVLMKLL